MKILRNASTQLAQRERKSQINQIFVTEHDYNQFPYNIYFKNMFNLELLSFLRTVIQRSLILFVVLLVFGCSSDYQDNNKTIEYTGKLVSKIQRNKEKKSPLLKAYIEAITTSLNSTPSVLTLNKNDLANKNAFLAQTIAIDNEQFNKYTKHPNTGQALRNEIMTVRKLLASDIITSNKKQLQSCQIDRCYRVEMYNFFFNMSVVAFVDTATKKLLSLNSYSDAQPDLNPNQIKLAIEIAKNSPLVQQELKLKGINIEPTMSQIKTSLKNSRCERSHHLCVAPTFVIGDKALWAIVDLTDGDLVGVKWTDLGNSGPPITVTERQLENEYVFTEFCEKSRHFKQGDWQFNYQITTSDGMELTQVKFKNKTVMSSVKLLDWHVSYSSRDGFGYSDAIGCPLFSSAVVIAYDGPQIEKIKNLNKTQGFAFIQDFRQPPWPTPCNYRYEQRFEFYQDGSFRIAAADYGRGCGTDGTYRPILRIDLEIDNNPEQVSQWSGKEWILWNKEQWQLQSTNTRYTDEGYLFKFSDANNQGYYVEPNRGQFKDGSKGDFAYTYFTVKHENKDEGQNDMITMGQCCNKDYKQGPEQFIKPAESLVNKNLVMWYVPQLKNNGNAGEEYCWADTVVENGIKNIRVWPCYAGPMFIPIENN